VELKLRIPPAAWRGDPAGAYPAATRGQVGRCVDGRSTAAMPGSQAREPLTRATAADAVTAADDGK